MGSPFRVFCKFFLFLPALLLMPAPALAQPSALVPRHVPEKPIRTRIGPDQDAGRVIVKFREGTRVRRGALGLEGAAAFDPALLQAVLARHGLAPGALRRLLALPETRLDELREHGERRSGRALADMNLYFRLDIPAGVDTARLCDELNALPFVELAEPAARAMPPPVDLPPPTPDFSAMQHYKDSPPTGIGALDPAVTPGADGSGTTLVDIEYSWTLDHEDLELPPSAMISVGTPLDPFNDTNHGTAVLGEISALANTYGMSGAARGVALRVAPASTIEFGYDVALAITEAASELGPGDTILLEQQMCVCGNTCDSFCNGCGPVEWQQASYDAISLATSQGITVVEAAGNGSVQLDAPACLGRFDRNVRDSEAIIVGAGDAFHERLSFSSHGSRLDLQAWGSLVATTGYGNLFDPGDERQRYTSSFSGTSSASAIVAAAAVAVQGAEIAGGGSPLEPASLRSLLTLTGDPQDECDPVAEKIGAFPNLPAALGLTSCGDGLDNDGDGLVDGLDPDCAGGAEVSPQCSDGGDNDGDGRTDLADGDCTAASDPSEWSLRPGDVLIADLGTPETWPGGFSQSLRVDPVSGFQTALAHPREASDAIALERLADGRLLGLDFVSARVFEIDPASQSVSFLGGCALRAWGFAQEAAGTIVFSDSAGASLHRFDPESGAQTVLSSGGLLSQPRGLGLEADGSFVMASSNSVLRVDAQSGAQSTVSSGGNLATLGGIAVDDCTGEIFAAAQGISSAEPALVRIHPAIGAQRVISSGGLFVLPVGVSVVRGVCTPLTLLGSALGGSLGMQIGSVFVSVPTVAGQPLAEILEALALAIRNHPSLESQGIAATFSGLVLQVRGDAPSVVPFSYDGGLWLRHAIPPSLPALPAAGLGVLAALLGAAGVLAQMRRREP